MNRYSKALTEFLKYGEFFENGCVLVADLMYIIPETTFDSCCKVREALLNDHKYVFQYRQNLWLLFAFLAELSEDDMNEFLKEISQ